MMLFPAQARLFDEPQLASLCLENIDKNTSDAINAEGFTDIDLGKLFSIPPSLFLSLHAFITSLFPKLLLVNNAWHLWLGCFGAIS